MDHRVRTKMICRRLILEAGCINNSLSQLQIVFNCELRCKRELSNMAGHGLRRI